jgi:hypothetical protein
MIFGKLKRDKNSGLIDLSVDLLIVFISRRDKNAMCKTCLKQTNIVLARQAKASYVAIMYFLAVEKYPLGLAKRMRLNMC